MVQASRIIIFMTIREYAVIAQLCVFRLRSKPTWIFKGCQQTNVRLSSRTKRTALSSRPKLHYLLRSIFWFIS